MNDETVLMNGGFSLSAEATLNGYCSNAPHEERNLQVVMANYNYWNKASNLMSVGNYDDENFKKIVSMGEDAVPGILKIIRDKPDPIVHALDLIYPGYMKYEGHVSLSDVCRLWTITLLSIGKF